MIVLSLHANTHTLTKKTYAHTHSDTQDKTWKIAFIVNNMSAEVRLSAPTALQQ